MDMSNLSLEDLNTKVPTILLYDQVNRVYRNSINLLCTKADLSTFNKYDTDEWAMQLQIEDNQISIPFGTFPRLSELVGGHDRDRELLSALPEIGLRERDECLFPGVSGEKLLREFQIQYVTALCESLRLAQY